MSSVAERRPPAERRHAPFLLPGHTRTCRAQPWSSAPDIAQVILLGHTSPPTADDLAAWVDQLRGLGFRRLRTTVLGQVAAQFLVEHGAPVIQELALLEHRRPIRGHDQARGHDQGPPTRRLLARERGSAAALDRAAFGVEWGLDEFAVHDVCTATPRHRARAVDLEGHPLAGYAISGRDGRQGFLQRVAVHPDARRRHVATALIADALQWAARWRVERVLVNTPVDNAAAIALYRATGFEMLDERMTVHEKVLS